MHAMIPNCHHMDLMLNRLKCLQYSSPMSKNLNFVKDIQRLGGIIITLMYLYSSVILSLKEVNPRDHTTE